MLVCAFGDLLLDVVVCPERPLAYGGDVVARNALVAGGQAANVAAWATALGARGRFLGVRSVDPAGQLAAAALERLGVELAGPVRCGRTGIVVSFVSGDGERTMASDRGSIAPLGADLDPAWLAGCDHLHLSGYALTDEATRGAVTRAVDLARAEGARVSLDLAASSVVERIGRAELADLLRALAVDIVFANTDEMQALGEPEEGPVWVVKRGPDGASFGAEHLPAVPVERVVDATGAGDALAAGWIVGGPGLALAAAARCVTLVGAMPSEGEVVRTEDAGIPPTEDGRP
jgi:sugar/nucleoside kinase (ribokinase family)